MSREVDSVRAPNIYDVARLAGVSHQTVSRVINGSASIRDETRLRVQRAMTQLNYRPSRVARSLATSKTRMIGVLADNSGLFGPVSLLHAMERQARQAGYYAVSASVDASSAASIEDGVNHLMALDIEAMVVIAPQSKVLDVVKSMIGQIPMVTIDSTNRSDVFSVAIDNEGGARIAVRHLIDRGHKKILHISGPDGWLESDARVRGYQLEMIANNLSPMEVIPGSWAAETGYQVGLRLCEKPLDFTAVFTANDHIAFGFIHALKSRGYTVPKDVSLIGFDDIPDCPYFDPPLTSIRQDFGEVGKRAIALLLDELGGTTNIRRERIVPKLVERESVSSR